MAITKSFSRAKDAARGSLLGEGLRAKAARGGVWIGGASFIEQLCRFTRNMLLARLLAPGAFGAMAIVLSAGSLVSSFSDVGIWPAIIHNPRGATTPYLNAAWWIGMARAILIYGALFLAAPWVGHFYGNSALCPLLRVILLSEVLDGLLSPRSKLAQKEMTFGRWAFIRNGGGICGVAVTIGLSLLLKNVWALAVGYCAENAFRCLFSYILYPGLPSLKWDRNALNDILHFSKGMLGLSFLNLLFTRSDIFVLGKLHPASTLGHYALAVNLVQTPTAFLIGMLAQTLLPTFAQVQTDKERLNRILNEVTSWVVLIGVPAVAMIWLCGPALLTIFYGRSYNATPVAHALGFAAIVALLNTLNSLITSLFFATGEPALHRRAVAVSASIMVAVTYPACLLLGLEGGQVAALIAITASFLLQILRIRKITGLSVVHYGKPFIPAGFASAAVLAAGTGAHLFGLGKNPFANIAIAASACLCAYLCCVPVFMNIRHVASLRLPNSQ
jgi:O-antigen/teichoic acid export membrane protein